MNRRPLYVSVLLIVVAVISATTLHEYLHLITGRILGIPARFVNWTSVGIPAANVPLHPAGRLAMMNGVAPFFTVLVFGILGHAFLTRRRKALPSSVTYLGAWWVISSLPYAGIQLMLIATPAHPNGTRVDSAAVAAFFGVPMVWRAVIGVLGYAAYVGLSFPLVGLLEHVDSAMQPSKEEFKVSLWRAILGVCFVGVGIVSVICGNILLVKGIGLGVLLIILGGLLSWGIGSACLTRWSSNPPSVIWRNWLLPLIVASLVFVLLGLEGNDYMTLCLVFISTVLGVAFLSTCNAYNIDAKA